MAPLTEVGPFLLMSLAILVGNHEISAQFVVQKDSITVVCPLSLGSKHDGAIGMFGVAGSNGFVEGNLLYPTNGSRGCKPFQGDMPFKSSIVLLDRGDCFFALKIWNAQQAGATGVLVADYLQEPLLKYESSSYIAAYTKRIHIPSALIMRSFGDRLKKSLNKNPENVVVKLEWKELSYSI